MVPNTLKKCIILEYIVFYVEVKQNINYLNFIKI
jgi:hypothetical protein